jgi:hypothetical protein
MFFLIVGAVKIHVPLVTHRPFESIYIMSYASADARNTRIVIVQSKCGYCPVEGVRQRLATPRKP